MTRVYKRITDTFSGMGVVSVDRRTPKYRRQKRPGRSDRAFVALSGRRHYLGAYDSPDSWRQYHQRVAEWMANLRQPLVPTTEITVVEVIARFWAHCRTYYRGPDGSPTAEVDSFKQVLRPLKSMYGDLPANQFGPIALKALRHWMIQRNWCRTHINRQINRIKHVFKWAVAQELVAPAVHQALSCVVGLKLGRCEARETPRKRPVPQDCIDAIKPHVSRQVWALIQLQLLTAARAGELVTLRAVDLTTGGDVWTYAPASHKTAHKGRPRTICFGPRAQAVLKPFLADRPIDAFLFSPKEAERERGDAAQSHRRSNQRPTQRITDRTLGDHYTTASYRRAIARACEWAFPHPNPKLRRKRSPDGWSETRAVFLSRLTAKERTELRNWVRVRQWHPHQLRHTAATAIRRQFGIEAAQVMLGHAKADVTQIYAEAHAMRAAEIASHCG